MNKENISSIAFEPKRNRHFIMEIDGIDSFLVKNVHLPALKPDENGNLVPKSFRLLRVFLYSAIAPSTEQQVADTLKKQVKGPLEPVELKYLDPAGAVVSHMRFHEPKIEEVVISNPDYSSSDITTVELIINFDSIELLF